MIKKEISRKIKKHNNKNEYFYSGDGLWVRNFTKKNVKPVDINNLIGEEDMKIMLENETINYSKMLQQVETECFTHDKILIVSDGYKFNERQKLLENLRGDVTIIGVNDSLLHWSNGRKMDYYVANNPYDDCLQSLPRYSRMFPKLIASTRTYPEFIERFNGLKYSYHPTIDYHYSGNKTESEHYIDDYRNAICASICLAYKFEVKKLMLFCCDNALGENRAAAERLENGLWLYPPQKTAHNLADSCLYWLKSAGIKTGYCSDGPEYKNAERVQPDKLSVFFA